MNAISRKLILEKAVTQMMDFLGSFDEERTVGSISRKEVKVIIKGQLKELESQMKKMGI